MDFFDLEQNYNNPYKASNQNFYNLNNYRYNPQPKFQNPLNNFNNEFEFQNNSNRNMTPISNFIGRNMLNNNNKANNYINSYPNQFNNNIYGINNNNQYNQYKPKETNNIISNKIKFKFEFPNKNNEINKHFEYPNNNNELLLKIFIYIYYYEKSLSEKNIFINNIDDKYYLINPNWLDEFKSYYSYNKLKMQLELVNINDYQYMFICFNNIINQIPEEAKPSFKPLPTNLKKEMIIKKPSPRGIILPKKIFDLIYKLDKDFMKIAPVKFIFKNNNIYYINNNNIYFGNYQNNAMFEPIYIFQYDSEEIELKEEKEIVKYNINEYIKEKKCNTLNSPQSLKNKEEKIGTLIIVNIKSLQNKSNRPKSHKLIKKAIKTENIKNNLGIESNNYEIEIKNKIKQSELNKQNITRNITDNNIQENQNFADEIKEIQMIKNESNNINNIDFGKELLKFFIYIYYYEKSLETKNIFLNNNDNYYLINPDWLEAFKNLYSYDDTIKDKFNLNDETIDYNNIDSKLDNVIKQISEKIKIIKKPLTDDLLDKKILTILSMKNNIPFISKGTILPSKIFNIIKNVYGESVKISAKNIYFKDNYIYYINKEKIIVGAFQKKALFLPIYICTYNSIDLMKGEKDKMFQSNINEYIKERHYNNKFDFQPLKDTEEKEIGSLIILFQNDPYFKIGKNPKNKNNKNNNNKNIKNQTTDDDNKLIGEQSYKQKENELININNKLNTRIKNLEQELEKKNEQLSNNKND